METEIELKFFVSPQFSEVLREKIPHNKILQHSSRELGNIYFDTPDNWLREHDIGMRIRRFDDVYVQTVKTSGRVVAGLHQRPEYNAEHTSDDPDVSLHPEEIWPEGRSVQELGDQLQPLFATNFTRELWLVGMADGSQVEVAFDQGVVVAGEKRSPICEVELELKSGQTDALFTLARQLCEDGGMRLGNLSKAARGYRLAQGFTGSETKALGLVEVTQQDNVESCFIKSLEYALAHWLYHEQAYVESPSMDCLHEICYSLSFVRQTLAVFGGIVPRRASAILRQELKWLEQELDWIKSADYLDDLTEDRGHALRKLDAQKALVKQLKVMRNDLPSEDEVLQLLESARYTGIILDLSRWVLTKGWQPFLDEKASNAMSGNLVSFSQNQLDRTWAELVSAFPVEQTLTPEDYIDEHYHLNRSLFSGICFAALYDQEMRQAFRLPWADLSQGIDELLTLAPVRELVGQLEGEEQEQLQRWLERQQASILHAMEQTRAMCMEVQPYWKS
ncbi:adenylate cyclase [Vibrio breoganii]|uniref:CYTH and CHAD domain-containing protein n=1 Tax=Vibrio breoganii TaxID=553239 RepID=UPI0002FE705B|nr:inorganic triphosphatase [Vibrio breoganii]OED94706.1 adenylate cyclase [Vibrio breoganii ZF-29]PMG03363.1 adenylate cyclase [Vibrio breoganii]PMG32346.1 adenylate cyclase [Vibrio breoganii]PMG92127.1 adenylate cyclase [Vibrio breoganii]PMK16907.1 adenylate cyclase [Vibrio breoganii]